MLTIQIIASLIFIISISLLVSFSVTFAITSLYISYHRKEIKKHSFNAPAEPYIIRREMELDKTPESQAVDGIHLNW